MGSLNEKNIKKSNYLLLILSFTFISACGKGKDDIGEEEIVTPTFKSFKIVGKNSDELLFNEDNEDISSLSFDDTGNPFGNNNKTIEEK